MTDWQKYSGMPGVTYPKPGSPELMRDEKPVVKNHGQNDPVIRAKRKKRVARRREAVVNLPANFGEISMSQAAREWGEKFEAARRRT